MKKVSVIFAAIVLVSLAIFTIDSASTKADKPGLPADVISVDAWKAQANYLSLAGHQIAYWQAGQGETVILVHGFPTSSRDWQHVWQALRPHYNVVTLDLLGYGLSAKPWPHRYSIMEQADIVMALADALELDSFHLLAHDYGDTVAQEILARHNAPAQTEAVVKSLCLLNGGLFPEAHNHTLVQYLLLSPLGPYLTMLYNQAMFDRNFSDIFADNTQPSQAQLNDIYATIQEHNGVRVFPGLIEYISERVEHRERWVGALQEATIPIRAIVGTDDQISGENMLARYESLLPAPDVIRLKNIGHYPQLEAPQALLAAYLPFLAKAGESLAY